MTTTGPPVVATWQSEPQALADPYRDRGGLQGLVDDGGQVISDRVQVHPSLSPAANVVGAASASYRALNRRSAGPTQNWPAGARGLPSLMTAAEQRE
jgi:hypothetical protein